MSPLVCFGRHRFFLHWNRRLFFVLIFVIAILNVILFLFIFTYTSAKLVTLEDMSKHLVPARTNLELQYNKKIKLCDLMPTFVNSFMPYPNLTVSGSYLKLLQSKLNIELGGVWQPSECISQHHVAIIVPYRDRLSHLQIFIAYMHPFLQLQKLSYQIFIIEQSDKRPFNRGKLFNVGFTEAEKLSDFPCYIFHDVDLIPQNLYNVYGCTQLPRHMSSYIDVFDYKLPYDVIFGGAVAILKDQFLCANGFSNNFFGWGGEDDDFYNRVTRNGTRICRYEYSVSKYIMLSHKKEKPSEDRYFFLQTGGDRFKVDGLNSLKYSVLQIDKRPLYTRILVDL
ncbi:beta-1,4-galactosyltransferase 1-like [Lycorma delicatula]|uniref:beta-1,4-galactosyltransferase 1-like n=1 Tax=Lycorma delicatula TaxID=130591 RepID=UPI003F516734